MTTRDKIIASTIKLVAREGAGISTDLICKDAGIAKGTLFNYFQTKDVLLSEAYKKCMDELGGYAVQMFRDDMSLEEMVSLLVDKTCTHAVEHPEMNFYVKEFHMYRHESPSDPSYYNIERYQGVFSDPKIHMRVEALADSGVPADFRIMSAASMLYKLAHYVASYPEKVNDEALRTFVIHCVMKCFE